MQLIYRHKEDALAVLLATFFLASLIKSTCSSVPFEWSWRGICNLNPNYLFKLTFIYIEGFIFRLRFEIVDNNGLNWNKEDASEFFSYARTAYAQVRIMKTEKWFLKTWQHQNFFHSAALFSRLYSLKMGFRWINIIVTKRAKLCIWYFKTNGNLLRNLSRFKL